MFFLLRQVAYKIPILMMHCESIKAYSTKVTYIYLKDTD